MPVRIHVDHLAIPRCKGVRITDAFVFLTAWCSEIGSLTSLNEPEFHAFQWRQRTNFTAPGCRMRCMTGERNPLLKPRYSENQSRNSRRVFVKVCVRQVVGTPSSRRTPKKEWIPKRLLYFVLSLTRFIFSHFFSPGSCAHTAHTHFLLLLLVFNKSIVVLLNLVVKTRVLVLRLRSAAEKSLKKKEKRTEIIKQNKRTWRFECVHARTRIHALVIKF